MAFRTRPTRSNFTVFRSASEQAEIKADQENWENEGGHMSFTAGRRHTHAWL